jgi:hypothetical protein
MAAINLLKTNSLPIFLGGSSCNLNSGLYIHKLTSQF